MNLTIPESYNDLTTAQLKKVQHILLTERHRIIAQRRIIKLLLDTKWYKFLNLRKLLKTIPLTTLWSYCDYIDHGTTRTDFIPIKASGKTYHGPIDKLFNITAGNFSAADSLYIAFCEQQDATIKERRQYLEYLAGALYEESSSPLRPLFNKTTLHQRARTFKRTSTSTLLCVLTAYAGSREHLHKKFKYVFPKPKTTTTKKLKKQKQSPGFDQIILNMAGDRIADYPIIENLPLYTFLEKMNKDLDPKNNR